MMYFNCWPETMFWRQRKINFENIFILPNVIGERSSTFQHSVHPDAVNEGTFTFIGGAPALSEANPVRGVNSKHSLVQMHHFVVL